MVVVGFYAGGKLEKVESNKMIKVVEVTESALRPRDGVSVVDTKKIKPTRISESIKKLPSIPVGGVTILRGPPPEEPFLRIVPIADSALIDDSPEFSWPQQEGATAYELSLYDVLRNAKLWVCETKDTNTTYSADQPLKPGRIYEWKVLAQTPNGQQLVCESEFTVVRAEKAAGLAELAASEEPSLLALAAAGYEKLGLLNEAIDTYERLVELTPQAATIHAALSDLYDRAGREQQASHARKTAVQLGFQFEKR